MAITKAPRDKAIKNSDKQEREFHFPGDADTPGMTVVAKDQEDAQKKYAKMKKGDTK